MTYDDRKMQVSEIECIDTDGQAITVPENYSMHYNHLIGYALKDKPIRFLSKTYFSDFVSIDKKATDYILINSADYKASRLDIFSGLNIEKIWDNGVFCLIRCDQKLRANLLSGFHGYECYDSIGFRWTSENDSTVGIENLTDDNRRFKVSLVIGDAPNAVKKNVQIILDGQIIGQGLSGSEIVTDEIEITGQAEKNIIIRTLEPLSSVDNGDTRLFGVSVISFTVIEE